MEKSLITEMSYLPVQVSKYSKLLVTDRSPCSLNPEQNLVIIIIYQVTGHLFSVKW